MSGEDVSMFARYVLRHFGIAPGPAPGSFYRALVDAIAAADPLNQARLAMGFPMQVGMFTAVQNDPDGITQVQRAVETGQWPPSAGA